MFLWDLMVTLAAAEAMSLTSVVNSDRNQASLECHVSKSQAVPATGISSTFSLQEIFPQPKLCCL